MILKKRFSYGVIIYSMFNNRGNMMSISDKRLFELLYTKIPEIRYLPQDQFSEFPLNDDLIVATELFSDTQPYNNLDPKVYMMDSKDFYCQKFGAPRNLYQYGTMLLSTTIIDMLRPIVMPLFKLPTKGDVLASIYDRKSDLFYGFRFNMKKETASFDFKAETDLRYLFKSNLCRRFLPSSQSEFVRYLSQLQLGI